MIRTVGIRPKPESAEAARLAVEMTEAFRKKGLRVETEISDKTELLVALGGDGTLLGAVRDLGSLREKIPVLGVHMSRGRGFLHPLATPPTGEKRTRWVEALGEALVAGKYRFLDRWGLEGGVRGETPRWALNDFVITKGALSRMIDMRILIEGEPMFEPLRGDGLILSSPTGSTAYALSAGGPILHASLKNILLTPVCPHELTARSIVLSGETRVAVEIVGDKGRSYLTIDGQCGEELAPGTVLEVGLSRAPIRVLEPELAEWPSRRYHEQLRTKLGLGRK
jgi:NAD+ kinase